jgi:hypothetical protein
VRRLLMRPRQDIALFDRLRDPLSVKNNVLQRLAFSPIKRPCGKFRAG